MTEVKLADKKVVRLVVKMVELLVVLLADW